MITFVIKSAICLTILYGFYHLFLHNIKIFVFNRYYLLFSLLFSIIISLITIRTSFVLPVNSNIHEFLNGTGSLLQREGKTVQPIHYFTVNNVLVTLYLIISFILLLRFALNIYKIIRQIRTSSLINNRKTKIVLIEKETLPYSFFNYIFINRSEYENGKIEKEVIIHEQVHCLQYHSVDILITELVKIILWFNPLLWLFRKAIQLNHEFLADDKVLSTHDLHDYQNTLLNLVFRNHSTYLASNLNYSLTKKRLIMMNKKMVKNRVILRKMSIIPLYLLLMITLAFAQVKEQKSSSNDKKGLRITNDQKAALKEQKASFQKGLADERKAAAEEQSASFQKGLADERKAAAEEQSAFFQEKLAGERKAAAEGTIVVGQKGKNK